MIIGNKTSCHPIRISNRIGPRAIKDQFHEYFQFLQNLENFANTNEINP